MSRTLSSARMPADSRLRQALRRNFAGASGLGLIALVAALAAALATWSVDDPSWSHATELPVRNALGTPGAVVSDLVMQFVGLTSAIFLMPLVAWGWSLLTGRRVSIARSRILAWAAGTAAAAAFISVLPVPASWPLPTGMGGYLGDLVLELPALLAGGPLSGVGRIIVGGLVAVAAAGLMAYAAGFPASAADTAVEADDDIEADDADDRPGRLSAMAGAASHMWLSARALLRRRTGRRTHDYAYPGEETFGRDEDFAAQPFVDEPPRRQARPRRIHVAQEPQFGPEPPLAAPALAARAPQAAARAEGQGRLGRLMRNLADVDDGLGGFVAAPPPRMPASPQAGPGRWSPGLPIPGLPCPAPQTTPLTAPVTAPWEDDGGAYQADHAPAPVPAPARRVTIHQPRVEPDFEAVQLPPREIPRPDPSVVPPPRPLRGPAALRKTAPAPDFGPDDVTDYGPESEPEIQADAPDDYGYDDFIAPLPNGRVEPAFEPLAAVSPQGRDWLKPRASAAEEIVRSVAPVERRAPA
ncbi:DNA translocase FtsK 4TM domain-containing protein, partial [Methylobrevis pamukkalensis]|uniref:DNA translocase FtsK 4TM domain-containing protein n=1 Tax=Methylobrevis pamukkalensis TaxID=1439726 RepID=UPI000A7F1399